MYSTSPSKYIPQWNFSRRLFPQTSGKRPEKKLKLYCGIFVREGRRTRSILPLPLLLPSLPYQSPIRRRTLLVSVLFVLFCFVFVFFLGGQGLVRVCTFQS